MRRFLMVFVSAALISAMPACSSSEDEESSSQSLGVAGQWLVKLERNSCPFPKSMFTGGAENAQGLTVTQLGPFLSAQFTDRFGNSIEMTGHMSGARFTGEWTMRSSALASLGQDRTIRFNSFGTLDSTGSVRQITGSFVVTSDDDNLINCYSEEFPFTADLGVAPPQGPDDPTDAEQVFQQCGPVDIVFMMDTSGSMDDEADALCEQIDQVLNNLNALGLTDIRVFKWGITEDADDHVDADEGDSNFACLTDNVRDLFDNPETPGTDGHMLDLGRDSDEDWGPGTAIVSHFGSGGRNGNFQWRSDAIKILVPISDEGPSNGDPADEPDDAFHISNAILFATANDVIVSPIIGTGAETSTSQHALDLAAGTGGIASRSTDPNLDIGQLIFDIVFLACGGELTPPEPPSDPGPTILVAAGRSGGLYQINPSTGADTFLIDTPILEIGAVNLRKVSSMVFNEVTQQLWAGTGGDTSTGIHAEIFSISPNGLANSVFYNGSRLDAHAGMTQRRSDRQIFSMEGDDDDLFAVNNTTGVAAKFADDIGDSLLDGLPEIGQALTFAGSEMYLASGTQLFKVDTFTGAPTLVANLTLVGFDDPPDEWTIASMTTRPSDGRVFAILNDKRSGLFDTYVCTINVANGAVTNLGVTQNLVDGITWVPAGYFGG